MKHLANAAFAVNIPLCPLIGAPSPSRVKAARLTEIAAGARATRSIAYTSGV